MNRHVHLANTTLAIICSAVLCLVLIGCESGSSTSAPEPEDATSAAPETDAPATEAGPEVADSMDIAQVDVPFGTVMASDGEYLYFSYRNHEDVGGLYRAKLPVEKAEMLDRGMFSDLYLLDGVLYYVEGAGLTSDGSSISYHRMDTRTLDKDDVSEEDFDTIRETVDPGEPYYDSKDREDVAVVGDCVYFIQWLGVAIDGGEDDVSVDDFALSYVGESSGVTQAVTWQHKGTPGWVVNAYGDYVVYSRPWESDPELTETDIEKHRFDDMPCLYDTKTGTETLLIRERSIQCDAYAVGATSGYVLVSTIDDELCDGTSMDFESLADPDVIINVDDLVKNATPASAFEEREASEKAAEEEALRNEPYGPGTSMLVLSAPEDKSAAFRLVRMDGSTEFMVLIGPGEEATQSFPSGRYTLKVAEGDIWISDEEAFGSDGSYSSTDVHRFEAGGTYEIGSGTRGDFRKDDASGFSG